MICNAVISSRCSSMKRWKDSTVSCADCVAAALKPAWADAVAASMRVTATQIASNPEWLQPDDFANPDPVAHLASLVATAARFPDHADLQAAQSELRAVLSHLPTSPQRERALAAVPAP